MLHGSRMLRRNPTGSSSLTGLQVSPAVRPFANAKKAFSCVTMKLLKRCSSKILLGGAMEGPRPAQSRRGHEAIPRCGSFSRQGVLESKEVSTIWAIWGRLEVWKMPSVVVRVHDERLVLRGCSPPGARMQLDLNVSGKWGVGANFQVAISCRRLSIIDRLGAAPKPAMETQAACGKRRSSRDAPLRMAFWGR
ncbi:hypothetical protein BU26DRAFT_137094 [Trematosphaeria pertusa]|uniref:Uncharacterized protein n=1 Tax=Trematosphaeria pertusa TaxID=390896 RepID=A0A6A6IVA2_9PLEO|nr:uncharacterized protein BU26DRAFT_137094 [Trematosphaeria pertusa]KAF2254364.1 hypothetical protein BU26DRAFT_137094 [Trematosphaeria pertusa]